MSRPPRPALLRFEEQFIPEPNTGCYIWLGCPNHNGYGSFKLTPTKQYRAHRAAYILYVGEIPKGMQVCHTCDHPWCVNPAHLWLGTGSDNMKDMVNKGRNEPHRGTSNKMSKLKTEDVQEIRRLLSEGVPQEKIAETFNIGQVTVSKIKLKKRWAHLQ